MSKKNSMRKAGQESKDYHIIMLEGASRELYAAQMLLRQGFMVSFPVADDRYDLLVEKHPYYFRIQVKPLNLDYVKNPDYATSIDTWKINAFTNPKGIKKTYAKEDIDFVMGIELSTSNFAIVPIEDVPGSGVIRISKKSVRGKYFNTFDAINSRTI